RTHSLTSTIKYSRMRSWGSRLVAVAEPLVWYELKMTRPQWLRSNWTVSGRSPEPPVQLTLPETSTLVSVETEFMTAQLERTPVMGTEPSLLSPPSWPSQPLKSLSPSTPFTFSPAVPSSAALSGCGVEGAVVAGSKLMRSGNTCST